jgi:hypothetical protein
MAIQDGQPGPDQSLLSLTQTDAAGRFRLENVPAGRYMIVAGFLDAPTYYPGVAAQPQATVISLAPGGEVTGIDFRIVVGTPLKFSGRVIREDLGGAPVSLPPASQPIQVRITGPRVPAQVIQVAADGSFEFPSVRPGTYQVMAMGQGIRILQPITVTLAEKDVTGFVLRVPFIVQLGSSTKVEGGGPEPRFRLTLTGTGTPSTPPLNLPNTGTMQVPTGEYRVTAADLPAGYTIAALVSGGVDLLASPLKVTAAGVAPIEIRLGVSSPPPWVKVSGRVQGRGLLNETNVVTNSANLSPLNPIFYLDGSFEFPEILPGSYSIRAAGAGGTSLTSPLNVINSNMKDVTIAVPIAGLLPRSDVTSAVRVTGSIRGRAKMLPGASVQLFGATDSAAIFSTPIYMDGSFEFVGLPPGTYSARVTPVIPGAVASILVVGTADLRGIEIAVPDTRDIPGRVIVEGKGPMPTALLFLIGNGVTLPVSLQSDGSFQITASEGSSPRITPASLPPGYSVKSISYGNRDLASNSLRFEGMEAERLRVTLNSPVQTFTVSGRINGNPPANANHVWLAESTGRYRTLETTITADRRFEFSGVAPGTYTAKLVGPGFSASTATAPVVVSERNVANLDFPAPREIRGRVVVTPNAPMPRFSIAVGQTILTVNPGTDGVFKAILPTGEARIGAAVGLPPQYALSSATLGRTADAVEELTIMLVYR